jgi:hypothetical protein
MELTMLDFFVLSMSVILGCTAYRLADKKNRSRWGWGIFTFIFPILIIFILLLGRHIPRTPCPVCGEMIPVGAKLCRFCGSQVIGVDSITK